MNREKYLKEIIKLLAILKVEIGLSNANNLTDINIYSENFYRDFLNVVYGYNLENTNFSEQNFPSIDLIDEKKKIAIQVTATSSLGKTQKTVQSFIKKKIHRKCNRLIILNIKNKSVHRKKTMGQSGVFEIDTKKDIWDVNDLTRDINNLTLDKIKLVHSFLQKELSPDRDSIQKIEIAISEKFSLKEDIQQNNRLLTQLVNQMSVAGTVSSSQNLGSDNAGFTSHLDRQIDQYRDTLMEDKPRTALQMLQSLYEGLPPDTEARIKYRIKANIAACHLRLEDRVTAAEGFLDAYNTCPDAPKADAHKVLGLILQNKVDEAIEFGTAQIQNTKDRAALYSNILMAKKFKPEDDNPFEFIPDDIQDDENVLVAKIDYLRLFNRRPAWGELAHHAIKIHPDNKILKRFDAEATLDEVATRLDAFEADRLDPQISNPIKGIISILREQWDEKQRSENAWDDYHISLSSNLANAYRIIGDFSAAAHILDEALKHVSQDQNLLERRFLVAVEGNDLSKIQVLLKTLPVTRDTVLGQLQWINNSGNWSEVENVPALDSVSSLSEDDKAFYEALAGLARYKLGEISDVRQFAHDLEVKYPGQVITQVVFHQVALNEGDQAWAENLYKTALQSKDHISHMRRIMLAGMAEVQEDFDMVIDLLEGIVEYDKDTDELKLLGRAYVNAKVRESAVDFANNLSAELKNNPYYARIVGNIHFNRGDLKEAETAFREVLKAEPSNVSAHIGLIHSLLREDRKEDVEKHIAGIKTENLKGPEIQKMGLAQIMVAFGREIDGLAYGYKTALNNFDNPRALLLYTGLILPNSKVKIPDIGDNVCVDSWLEIKVDGNEKRKIVIEEGQARPSQGHFPPTHETAKILLGKRVGDVISTAPALGSSETWEILSIKHKYVGLLHEIIHTFPTRFPDHGGFYTYKIQDGDISNVLNDIKRFSERDDQILDLYENQHFPLELAGAMCGDSFATLAQQIVRKGRFIKACLGATQERQAALSLCKEAADRGVVMDTHTAWTAYVLGIVPILKILFPRLVIPRSSLDELYERRQYFESHGNEPFMTVRYENGQYFREEVQPEHIKNAVAAVNETIDFFKSNFEILPAAAPASPTEFEQKLVEIGGAHIFDPGYLSKSEGLPLLSDDMNYRNLLKNLYGIAGFWLQIPLMAALEKNQCTLTEYATAVFGLARHRHAHITLNSQVLTEICNLDRGDNIDKFSCVIEFIGGQNADPVSHFNVAQEFLHQLWNTDLPHLSKAQATGMTLDRIAGMMHRHNVLNEVFKELIANAQKIPLLRDYILGWLRGHFIFIA